MYHFSTILESDLSEDLPICIFCDCYGAKIIEGVYVSLSRQTRVAEQRRTIGLGVAKAADGYADNRAWMLSPGQWRITSHL
jgi:hypothetical protein